jgi:predicted metal-binding membrane protein
MTAAMMLPSALPVLLAVDRISRRAAPFALGYVVAWTAWGLVVYGAALVGARAGLHGSRWLTAGALVVAALYQLAPAKDACLRRCRAPLAVALAQRQGGRLHVLRGGIVYGALCVGCCAGLMLALLVLGMASVLWLLVAATAIAAEKLLPHGERLVWPFGLLLLVLAGAGL